uniref:Hyaluronan synthase n=1 Tax=Paramecium bursaria Chlorella virus 1 TaxID=10506 RepID=Q9WFS9_PBCV1|nr:hyaluronan synthase [Paramecium bursaria Chlorella virus 1]
MGKNIIIMVSWYTIITSNLIAVGGASLILAPAITGYVLHWNIALSTIWGVSAYGIFVFGFFLAQVLFSELNRKRLRKWISLRPKGWNDVRLAVIIAGYREDPYMFQKCLESVRDSDYGNVARLICVIDGDEDDDMKMAAVYKAIYNDNIKKPEFVLCESDDKEGERIDSDFSRDICVLQPHRGKRECLYTGFQLAKMDPSVNAVVLIDSDTVLEKDAILEVVYPLACDPEIQAVAGECKIWNTDTLLSLLVAWRYYSAFCVERSAQSFFRTVQCVGGPLGAYKIDIIKEIKDPWISQRFLGQKCTYGDDRRLTNEILMRGKKVVFTPFAVGWSDSPTNVFRYIVQQTRWSKSWCREIWYTLFAAWKHGLSGIWLAFECLYQITYFFLVIYLFSRLAVEADPRAQTATVIVSTTVALIKCGYFSFRAKDIRAFYFVLYTFVYFFCMIPARVTAMMTLWDIGWGTRGGNEKPSVGTRVALWAKQYLIAYMWWAAVVGAGVYSIVHNWMFDWNSLSYRFALVGICSYIVFITIVLVIYFTGKITTWNFTKLQKELIKDRVLYDASTNAQSV